MAVQWAVGKRGDINLVEFNIEGGVLDPSELVSAVENAPVVKDKDLVCISGRGPVWLYAAVVHKYALLGNAVATYEPRLNACIVVAPGGEYKLGEIKLLK